MGRGSSDDLEIVESIHVRISGMVFSAYKAASLSLGSMTKISGKPAHGDALPAATKAVLGAYRANADSSSNTLVQGIRPTSIAIKVVFGWRNDVFAATLERSEKMDSDDRIGQNGCVSLIASASKSPVGDCDDRFEEMERILVVQIVDSRAADEDFATSSAADIARSASGDISRSASANVARSASGHVARSAGADVARSAGGDIARSAAGDIARSASAGVSGPPANGSHR